MRQRIVRTQEEWEEIIRRCWSECETSGMSKTEWMAENHIEQTSFFRHQRRLVPAAEPDPDESGAVVIPLAAVTHNYPVMITITSGRVTIEVSESVSEHLSECIGRMISHAL